MERLWKTVDVNMGEKSESLKGTKPRKSMKKGFSEISVTDTQERRVESLV